MLAFGPAHDVATRLRLRRAELLEDSMKIFRARSFRADRAWGAEDIARIDGVTVRMHWTNAPYKWHVNDGPEVFAVLDGEVDMHVRVDGAVRILRLQAGDV